MDEGSLLVGALGRATVTLPLQWEQQAQGPVSQLHAPRIPSEPQHLPG